MANQEQTILIVDDEAAIRRLLSQKLTKHGYHCEEAGSSDEALDKMMTYSADLIMLDLKMPENQEWIYFRNLKLSTPQPQWLWQRQLLKLILQFSV